MNKNLIILLAVASFLFTGCKKSTSEAFSYTAWGDYGAHNRSDLRSLLE
jgi:outer membrane biogenesis lipoprotein LolB